MSDVFCETEVLDKSVDFPLGIPGFPNAKRFVFARQPDEHPFAWMRCLDDTSLAFAVVEAYHLLPDFSFEVDDKELEVIGNPSPQECALFFIVKIDVEQKIKITANSAAPLLINVTKRKGRQIILPSDKISVEPIVMELAKC